MRRSGPSSERAPRLEQSTSPFAMSALTSFQLAAARPQLLRRSSRRVSVALAAGGQIKARDQGVHRLRTPPDAAGTCVRFR